tara:strand:- start:3858 stop:5048 length:1191 start_codon:yes stop_codon:yes gene_type:complete
MKKKFKFFVCVAVSLFYSSEIVAQTTLTTEENVLQAIENNTLMSSEIIKAGDTIFLDTASMSISSSRKKFLRWRRDAMPRSDFYGSTSNSTPQDFYNYLNGMNLGLACQSGPVGSVWRSLGPNPDPSMHQEIGLVSNVACHPNNENIIYAGTEESGLWKTINGGVDWVNLTDNLNRINMGVATISIDPTNANNIVIGTNSGSFIYPDKGTTSGHGIFYSTDGGNNWTQSAVTGNPSTYWAAENIQRQPSNSDVLICAGGKNIYKSTDGGQSWNSVFANTTPGDHNKLFKVEFSLDPAKTGEVFVSTRLKDHGTPKVFFSSNTGNSGSWTEVTPPNSSTSQMIELATTADDVLHVYAAFKQVSNSPNQTYILKPMMVDKTGQPFLPVRLQVHLVVGD